MRVGMARGGPVDGQEFTIRRPTGFILVDKLAGRAWLYDWSPERREYAVREADGRELDHERRWHAAESGDYDIVAAPWVM